MLPALKKNISSMEIPKQHINSAAKTSIYALNHYAMAISGRLCSVDGEVNLTEKKSFLQLFPYFKHDQLGMFKDCANDNNSVYLSCKRFCKFSNNDPKIAGKLYGRLFKLATSDSTLNVYEISFLEKIISMLGLPNILLDKALEYYFLDDLKHPGGLFASKKKVKNFYRSQISKLHPDSFHGAGALTERTRKVIMSLANERVKILNENYRKSFS